MNLLELCGNEAATEAICECLKVGKLGCIFTKLDQRYSDTRNFGEIFAKWSFEQICCCISRIRKLPLVGRGIDDASEIDGQCGISLYIANMAIILATIINFQVISLSASISIIHKLLSIRLASPTATSTGTYWSDNFARMVDEECTQSGTTKKERLRDGMLLKSPSELLLFIQVLTGNCVALIKSLGCRIVYILANSPGFNVANPTLADSLRVWALDLLRRQREASIFDGAANSSSNNRHQFDFSAEDDMVSSSSSSSSSLGVGGSASANKYSSVVSDSLHSPGAPSLSTLTPLQRASPYFFKDQDDEVIGYIQSNHSFLKGYSEDYDNKLDYKTQVEQGMYNERERVSDFFIELIRQYQEISRSDVSGYRMKEFLAQLKTQVSLKILCVHDLSMPWLADLFVKLLLFHGVNVIASAPTLLASASASASASAVASCSSPGTGDNTPARSTPVQFGSVSRTLLGRSDSITGEVHTALGLCSSSAPSAVLSTQQLPDNNLGPSTPPRAGTSGQSTAGAATMSVQDQLRPPRLDTPAGVLNGTARSPSSAPSPSLAPKHHAHSLHTYDKQKLLEERMEGKSDGQEQINADSLFPGGMTSLGAATGGNGLAWGSTSASTAVPAWSKSTSMATTSSGPSQSQFKVSTTSGFAMRSAVSSDMNKSASVSARNSLIAEEPLPTVNVDKSAVSVMASAMTARPVQGKSSSNGNTSQAHKKAQNRVKPEKLSNTVGAGGTFAAAVGGTGVSSFATAVGVNSVSCSSSFSGQGQALSVSVWGNGSNSGPAVNPNSTFPKQIAPNAIRRKTSSTANSSSVSSSAVSEQVGSVWGKGMKKVGGKHRETNGAGVSASGDRSGGNLGSGSSNGGSSKSRISVQIGAGSGVATDPYERPEAELFGGNLMFFFRLIVLTDSFKFGKNLEYAITTELVALMSSLRESLEASIEARGHMHMHMDMGEGLDESVLLSSEGDGDVPIGPSSSAFDDFHAVSSTNNDTSSSVSSHGSGSEELPGGVFRGMIHSSHRGKGKQNRLPISVLLMKMKVLGKFLGLLHFYPQWTIVAGQSSNGNSNGSSANSNGELSSSSPIMRMSREFARQRRLFYEIRLGDGGKGDRSEHDVNLKKSVRITNMSQSHIRSDVVPLYQWLVRARARRQLITVIPWIIEFLKCSKYDTVTYGRGGSGSGTTAGTTTGSGSTSLGNTASISASATAEHSNAHPYEHVILELLSIEAELITFSSQQSVGHAHVVSTTRTYLLLHIQEIYSICPYLYLMQLRKRMTEAHRETRSPNVTTPSAFAEGSTAGSVSIINEATSIDGFAGANLLGLSGFVRHVTPQLYDFVHSLQRQIQTPASSTVMSVNKSLVVGAGAVQHIESKNALAFSPNAKMVSPSGLKDGATGILPATVATTPTLKRQIVPTAVVTPTAASNSASNSSSSNSIGAPALSMPLPPSGLLSPISHQFIASFNHDIHLAGASSFGKSPRAVSATTVTANLSETRRDRSSSMSDRMSNNEIVTSRLQAGFWTQHPALDSLRGFVIDYLLQLGLKHMKEHVAIGVRMMWNRCGELKLRTGASMTAVAVQPSPVTDLQQAQAQLYGSPAYQLQQAQFQTYGEQLNELASAVKRQVVNDTHANFLNQFIEVQGMGAITALCSVYDPHTLSASTTAGSLVMMAQLNGKLQQPQADSKLSNEQRVIALAIKLIGAELRTHVRDQLSSFLTSYLRKKLSEVTQLALTQYKKAYKLEVRPIATAIASPSAPGSVATVVSNMGPIDADGNCASNCLGGNCGNIKVESVAILRLKETVAEVNAVSSRILSSFIVENMETEMGRCWKVRLGEAHGHTVSYHVQTTAAAGEEASSVRSQNRFSQMCNDFELVFQRTAKAWALQQQVDGGIAEEPQHCLKEWSILLDNLKLLCTCWMQHSVRGPLPTSASLAVGRGSSASTTKGVDLFRLANLLLPTWVYLDSVYVSARLLQMGEQKVDRPCAFVSDILTDCGVFSASQLVRIYTIACKPQTISFHENCLGLVFSTKKTVMVPMTYKLFTEATDEADEGCVISLFQPRVLLLLNMMRHIHAIYLRYSADNDRVEGIDHNSDSSRFPIIELFLNPSTAVIATSDLVALRKFVVEHMNNSSSGSAAVPSDLVTLASNVIVALLSSNSA